jgi:hypothetical protein
MVLRNLTGAVALLLGAALGLWLYTRNAPTPRDRDSAAAEQAVFDAANRVFPDAAGTDPATAPPVSTSPEPVTAPSEGASGGPAPAAVPPADAGSTAPTPEQAATAALPIAPAGFKVVAGSFRDKWRATALARRIAGLDLPVRVQSASGLARVVVGRFATIEEAEAARQRLRDVDVAAAVIAPSARPNQPAPSPVALAAPPRTDGSRHPSLSQRAVEAPRTQAPSERQVPNPSSGAVTSTSDATSAPNAASLFDRGRGLAQEGDVRGLLRLRESAESRLARDGWAHDDVVRMLRDLDRLFDQARRRRLELDAETFATER